MMKKSVALSGVMCMILTAVVVLALATPVHAQSCSGSAYSGESLVTESAEGVSGTVWGSGPFTTDSHIPTIAAFLGARGSATLYITDEGCTASFTGSTANGVTTSSYTAWRGMNVTCISGCDAGGGGEEPVCDGSDYAGASPRTVTSTSIGTVYGTGPFRTTSSLGKIARYLGASGSATLVITNVGCVSSFAGGTNNGVSTLAYGSSYKGMTVSCTSGCAASCSLPWGGTINSGQSTTAYQASSVPYGSSCTSQTRTCTNGTLSGSYTNQSCTVASGATCALPWGGTINSGQSTTAYLNATVPVGSSCTSQSRSCTNGTLSGSYTNQSCSVVTGGPSANVNPGDTVRVTWAATNGWSYSSTYSVNQNDACGNTGGVNYPWTANTVSGFSDVVIAACQAGRTYTYTYRVINSAGFPVTSSATVTVTAVTSCMLSASPNPILRGQNSTVSWTSSNATSGTVNPGSVGASPVDAGSTSVAPVATTTYVGSFTGVSGTVACTPVTLNVQCAPLYSCSGQQIQYTNAGCTTVNVGPACVSPMVCVPGQSTCQSLTPVFNAGVNTTGHLEANPQLVRKGASSKLFWNVSNVSSCTITGSNGDTVAAGCASNTCASGAQGQSTVAINSTVLYTMSCSAGSASFSETVTVLPSPEYKEQ